MHRVGAKNTQINAQERLEKCVKMRMEKQNNFQCAFHFTFFVIVETYFSSAFMMKSN